MSNPVIYSPQMIERIASRKRSLEKTTSLAESLKNSEVLPILLLAATVVLLGLAFVETEVLVRNLFAASAIVLLAFSLRLTSNSKGVQTSRERTIEIGGTNMFEIENNKEQAFQPTSRHLLMDGIFTGVDARDLINALVKAAVDDSKCRSLRSQVNCHEADDLALRQIECLERAREELRETLLRANSKGKRVRMKTIVELTVDSDTGPIDSPQNPRSLVHN